MNNLIKVVSPVKLKELECAGFSTYMTEKLNGQDVFVFSKTPELTSFLESHFSNGDFFTSSKIHF